VKLFFTILFLLIINSNLQAQKESYNWYFGEYAGITFNTPDIHPIPMINGALNTDEGCATISDAKGKLLFYTDGITVYNRNNVIMTGGTGLMGSHSSTQSALIIPKPGSTSIYYIITTDDAGGTNGCQYSTVDMDRQSGFGEVVSKNIFLFNSTTEKLIGIKHANGKDWWILTHEWQSDVFRAFLVDNSGINKFAIFSIVGKSHQGNPRNKSGYMKASKDGTKIALVLPENNAVEIFEFDNLNGKVFNPVYLTSLVLQDVYGVEFSPTARKLYVSKQKAPSAIFQYDLSSWSQLGILNTQTLITQDTGKGAYLALQIGPDNKIYVARDNKAFIGRINLPENPGFFTDYVDSAVSLKSKICKKGLPNIVSNDVIDITIKTNSPVCIADSVILSTDYVFLAKYQWTGPNGFYSDKQNVSFLAIDVNQSGYYKLIMTVSGIEYIDSVYVQISKPPEVSFSIIGNQPLCDGDSISLIAESSDAEQYLWSTGDTTKSIVIKKSGNYQVRVIGAGLCSSVKDTTIMFQKIPTEIVPIGPTEFCRGDSVELIALPFESGSQLLWSNGSTGQSIVVKTSDTIILKITSIEGCVKFDTLPVHVYDRLKVKVISDNGFVFCEGDTAIIKTNYLGPDFIYLWSTGETTPEIKLTDNFSGWVIVRLKSGCGDTAYFSARFNIKPNVFISTDKPPAICDGDVVTLTALTNNTMETLHYIWSSGDTTKSIIVSQSGKYTVTVTTDSGCSNQTYIDINVLPSPNAQIVPDGPLEQCAGGLLKLTAIPDSADYSYIWSNGSTQREIYVNKSGQYFVVIKNKNDCSDTALITVTFYDKPVVKIYSDGPLNICEGNTVQLSTTKKYLKYLWNTGDSTEAISVSSTGQYWVSVIDSNGCDAISDTVSVFVSIVDINIDDLGQTKFGNVCIGESKEQSFAITNNSNAAIFIESLKLNSNLDYSLQTEPQLPATIERNQSLIVHLNFFPKFLGKFLDTLSLSITSPCFYKYQISVEGNGISRIFARIPDTARPIGATYCIPVLMKLNCGDTLNQRVNFKTQVSLDATMFLPETTLHPFVKNMYVSGGKRFFEIEGWVDSLTTEEKEVFSICGTVLLGDYIWVNVDLADIEFETPYLTSVSQDGQYEIYGICAFEISSIKLSDTTKMYVYQNINDDNIGIVINTEEKGKLNLEMFNINGLSVLKHQFYNDKEGKTEFRYTPDISELANGYYLIVLTTGNSLISTHLIIYK